MQEGRVLTGYGGDLGAESSAESSAAFVSYSRPSVA